LPHVPAPSDVADSLNLSERTLRRKLAQEGLTYRTLLDDGRKARALELMMIGRQSIAEVTTETGFSDTRSFSRAFKRWTGLAPSKVLKGVPLAGDDVDADG
jgi:AraC-like DNA-binding protein